MPKKYNGKQKYKPRGKNIKGKDKISGYISTSKAVQEGNRAMGVTPYGVKAEPFPRVLLTKCRFGESNSITTTLADVSVANPYRVISIYDPYYQTGGKTVVGLSTLQSIYNLYWVMGAKVTVRFYDVPNDGWIVGVRLRINGNDPVTGENTTQIMERPLTYVTGLSDTGNQQKTFKFYIKPWSLVGISKLEYMANSSAYSSFTNNNPGSVDNALIDVFAVNTTTTGTVKYEIRIDYYTKFYGRKELTSS